MLLLTDKENQEDVFEQSLSMLQCKAKYYICEPAVRSVHDCNAKMFGPGLWPNPSHRPADGHIPVFYIYRQIVISIAIVSFQ